MAIFNSGSPYLRRFFALALGSFVPMAASVVAVKILYQFAEPVELVAIATVWVISGVASSLDLGLGRSYGRFLSQCDPNHVRSKRLQQGVELWLLMASLLVGLVLTLLYDRVIGSSSASVLLAVLLNSSASVIFGGTRHIWEASDRVVYSSATNALIGVLLYIFPAILVLSDITLQAAIIISLWVRVVAIGIICRKSWALLPLRPFRLGRLYSCKVKVLRAVFFDGPWFPLYSLSCVVSSQADRICATTFFSGLEIPRYTVVTDLIGKLAIVPALASRAVSPLFERAVAHAPASAKAGRLVLVAALACTITLCVSPVVPSFLRWWLGSGYSPVSTQVALGALAAVALNCYTLCCTTILFAHGRSRQVFFAQLAATLTFVPLAIVAGIFGGASWLAGTVVLRTLLEECLLLLSLRKIVHGEGAKIILLHSPSILAVGLAFLPHISLVGVSP